MQRRFLSDSCLKENPQCNVRSEESSPAAFRENINKHPLHHLGRRLRLNNRFPPLLTGITLILNTLKHRCSFAPTSSFQETRNIQESLWGSKEQAVSLHSPSCPMKPMISHCLVVALIQPIHPPLTAHRPPCSCKHPFSPSQAAHQRSLYSVGAQP